MNNRNYIMQAAIAGAFLASASVCAGEPSSGITIGASPASTPVLFAQELIPSSTLSLTNLSNAIDLVVPISFSMSPNEVRNVRFELSGAEFPSSGLTVTPSTCVTAGAVNGVGTSAVSFPVTAGSAGCAADVTLTLASPTFDKVASNAAPITAMYAMYDSTSQAANGGTLGRIVSKGPSNIIAFGPSYKATGSAADTVIADVAATGTPYSKFVSNTVVSTTLAKLSTIDYSLVSGTSTPTPVMANGSAMTLAALMATGSSGTTLVVSGDFTAVAATSGSTGTVFLSDGSCTSGGSALTATLTGSTATFAVGATATGSGTNTLCYQINGTTAVPVQKPYTAKLKPVSAAPSTYAVTDITLSNVGSIDRNGTVLETPMFSNAAGYNNRFVFMNSGPAAAYTTECQVEAGKTATAGSAATGTLQPGQNVILSTNVCTVTGTATASGNGAARGSIRFTIATPPNLMKGVYNSVAPGGSFDAIEMLPVRTDLVRQTK